MARKRRAASTAPITCSVTPDPVHRGDQYFVHATGLEPGVFYDAWATDTHGVQVFGFDDTGTASSYASWDGPYTVEVKPAGVEQPALATCEFTVLP